MPMTGIRKQWIEPLTRKEWSTISWRKVFLNTQTGELVFTSNVKTLHLMNRGGELLVISSPSEFTGS